MSSLWTCSFIHSIVAAAAHMQARSRIPRSSSTAGQSTKHMAINNCFDPFSPTSHMDRTATYTQLQQ